MGDPVTLTIIGIAGLAASLTGEIAGDLIGYDQAKNQAEVAEKNAKLQLAQMEYNQRMAEREADALAAENIENARRMRIQAEAARSQRIAMLGKSGAAMSSGSPLAVLGAAAADEELAIQDAHYTGARQVGQLRSKATDYGYGAAIARNNVYAASASRPSGLGLGATILGQTGSKLVQGVSLYSGLNKSASNTAANSANSKK